MKAIISARSVSMLFAVLWLGLSNAVAAAEENKAFPYRSHYRDVAVMQTSALSQRFDQVVIVDVRSSYEYDVLHIKGAVNIPISEARFAEDVKALRQKTGKPIVFYCNGVTCAKSYDAARLALNNRLDECYAYDAGVFAWANAYPDRTALLGKSPMKPSDLLDDDKFKARLISPKDFEAKIGNSAIVLDVRDRMQRDVPLFPLKEQRAELDEKRKIDALIEQAKKEKKTLLVYDAVGKQVQWFQYELEGKGLKNYYFMKGGAKAYWDHKHGKVSAAR